MELKMEPTKAVQVEPQERIRQLLIDAVVELGYVQCAEDFSQLRSAQGDHIIESGMALLGLNDLSEEEVARVRACFLSSPAPSVSGWGFSENIAVLPTSAEIAAAEMSRAASVREKLAVEQAGTSSRSCPWCGSEIFQSGGYWHCRNITCSYLGKIEQLAAGQGEGARDIEEFVKEYELSAAYCGQHAPKTRAESHINLRAAMRAYSSQQTAALEAKVRELEKESQMWEHEYSAEVDFNDEGGRKEMQAKLEVAETKLRELREKGLNSQ